MVSKSYNSQQRLPLYKEYCYQNVSFNWRLYLVTPKNPPCHGAGFRRCRRHCFCPSGRAESTGHVTYHPHPHQWLHLVWSGRWCPWVWRPPLGWTRRPRWDPQPGRSGTERLWKYNTMLKIVLLRRLFLHWNGSRTHHVNFRDLLFGLLVHITVWKGW